jgi:murein DD-endopeptidase MepM/ murein hydrolase activator NlpD
MLSKRFLLTIADPSSGKARSLRFTPKVALLLVGSVTVFPLLFAVGTRLSVSFELARLRAGNEALQQENASYRAATGRLTEQIATLQSVVDELGETAKVDPSTAAAIAKLPSRVRNQAMGGVALSPLTATALISAAVTSPENTFGILRQLLGVLEDRLQIVRTDAERWQALSRATPAIWPAVGWLTAGFGRRSDPFTGEPAQHLGLDISGDKGQPVFATADGIVQSAGWASDFGNLVVVAHDFGLTTRYAHLSRLAVQAGSVVQRGEVIGYIGSTGRSSGTHLHYEVWANGRPMNPLQLLTAPPRK